MIRSPLSRIQLIRQRLAAAHDDLTKLNQRKEKVRYEIDEAAHHVRQAFGALARARLLLGYGGKE